MELDKLQYTIATPTYSSGTLLTDRRFTGQRWEQGLGLYDYNARWYHPALGRFVSADTVVPEPGNPQSLNRFAYVANNPLKYVDPSGHSWLSDLVRNVEAGITNLGIAIGQSGPVGEALMIHAAEMMDPLKSIADAERNPSMASVHSSFWEGAEGWDGAFDSMGEVGIYTVSAIAEGRWEDASRGASGLAQMEGTLAQVPVKVAYQVTKGVVTFPVQVCEDAWEFGSAAREAYSGERGGWDVVWHATMLAGDVYAVYSVGTGREYKSDRDHRIAPFGNRTGHPTGELPHYHRRVITPSGETVPGQGIGRHRPWDTKSTDVSFWDRW